MTEPKRTVTTLYFIRHGESKGNKEQRFRGRSDFPLNQRGIGQAKALGDALKDSGITHIYTSPLCRAKKTGEFLAKALQIPLEINEGFQNITLGPWDGQPKEWVEKEYPEKWQLWLTNPEKVTFPGAETMEELQKRSFKTLEEVVEKHGGDTIAIVSHRALFKPLIARCLGIPAPYFWRTHMDTASYTILRHEPKRGYCCTLLNQTTHLGDVVQEWV